jgi:hypothetical protein
LLELGSASAPSDVVVIVVVSRVVVSLVVCWETTSDGIRASAPRAVSFNFIIFLLSARIYGE